MDKARLAVGRLGLAQEMIEPFLRDLLALGIPAHLGRLGEAIDLPRLHEGPPRREPVGAAVLIEAIDKAAARVIPALSRPQWQGALDDEVFQHSDNVAGLSGRGRITHCYS